MKHFLPWVFISVTSNNVFLTFVNFEGKTLRNLSAGNVGFKGSRRSSGYAAQVVGENLARWILLGLKSSVLNSTIEVGVVIRGLGESREGALKGLILGGLKIKFLEDQTNFAHNGCRVRKIRRV